MNTSGPLKMTDMKMHDMKLAQKWQTSETAEYIK